MSWRIKPSCLVVIVVCLFLARSLFAQPLDTPLIPGTEDPLPIKALVAEVQTITDAVLEHHIDPPTRQEMWLAGAKALLANAGAIHHPGLSAEISRLTSPEDFAQFAKRLWLNDSIRKHAKSAEASRQTFIEGVLAAVPGGARLIPQKDLIVQEQFQGNRYIGTGIAAAYDVEKKYPRIANVIPGGPMEQAGGRQGDLILKINDHDAHGLKIGAVIDLLRGEEGTTVTLVVGDTVENPRTISVTRGPVVLETLHVQRKSDNGDAWDDRIDGNAALWHVKIVQINGSTVHDLRKVDQRIRRSGARGVILDLRGLNHGTLHHAVLLADALLDGGVIGRERTQQGVHDFRADRDRLFRDLPFAVLVDSDTRAAAEWVAAAVQDNRAGIVVGETTAGYWDVVSAIPLPKMNAAISIKTCVFERPIAPARKSQELNPRPMPGAVAAVGPAGVTPDCRIRPRSQVAAADPFGVLPKPVRPVSPPPNPLAPEGTGVGDSILELAVKVLTIKINEPPTDGD